MNDDKITELKNIWDTEPKGAQYQEIIKGSEREIYHLDPGNPLFMKIDKKA